MLPKTQVSALAIAASCVDDRRYLRWRSQLVAFFLDNNHQFQHEYEIPWLLTTKENF